LSEYYIWKLYETQKLRKKYNEDNCNDTSSSNNIVINELFRCKKNEETNGNQKVAKKYYCNICNYNTSRKSSYDKHILSRKHTDGNISQPKVANNCDNINKCELCNKFYKNRSGLWKHKQQCKKLNHIDVNSNQEYNLIPLVLELVKQNSEFKELIFEQNKQLIEISKEKTIHNSNNNTSNSHNTTNNNHFNLNLFLNERCKNAMNINEFVEQIPVSIHDLEDTARLGYVEGISRIFIKGLKKLEINERPIHCSDVKRETVYIKEGNVWEKDDSDKSKLTNAIRKVGHKNIRMIPEWKKQYPDCEDYYSNKNDLYLKIVNQSMCGGSEEETEMNYNKIKKNIIKQVIIDK
jgi:hypothetical protein